MFTEMLTSIPRTFTHLICLRTMGEVDERGVYHERKAISEFTGYDFFFDITSPKYYAKIDENAIYLHAVLSGLSEGHELIYLGI